MPDFVRSTVETYTRWWEEADVGTPYPYQMNILRHKGSLIVNKARQAGFSTTVACIAVKEAALHGSKVLIVSKDQAASIHILVDLGIPFLRVLNRWGMAESPIVERMQLVQWPNGGEIRCFPSNEEAARGFTGDVAILDEAAHFTREQGLDRKLWQSLVPTIGAAHGRILVQSTPNGMGNLFEELFHNFPMPRYEVSWKECPRLVSIIRTEERVGETLYWVGEAPFSESDFKQEYENSFTAGSSSALPFDALWAAEVKPGSKDEYEPWELQ